MDWIANNDEQELSADLIEMDEENAIQKLPASADMGPCHIQTLSGIQGNMHDGCELDSVLVIYHLRHPTCQKKKIKML